MVEEEPVGAKEGEYVDSMVGGTDVVEGAAGGAVGSFLLVDNHTGSTLAAGLVA